MHTSLDMLRTDKARESGLVCDVCEERFPSLSVVTLKYRGEPDYMARCVSLCDSCFESAPDGVLFLCEVCDQFVSQNDHLHFHEEEV